MEEVKETWALGKQLGLCAKNEDEVIPALVRGNDTRKCEALQNTRK